MLSPGVAELLFQLRAAGIEDGLAMEFAFDATRQWRFDLAFPDNRLAVEVDGGSWISGRHTSGAGFERDCEKMSAAAGLGWRVVRCTPRQVTDGKALQWIEKALAYEPCG